MLYRIALAIVPPLPFGPRTQRFERALASLAIAAVVAWTVIPPRHAQGELRFTDFTLIMPETSHSSGTIGPIPVSFSGRTIDFGSVTDNSFTGFNNAFFAPPLPSSDAVRFHGAVPIELDTFVIDFFAPVTNPRLHLYSLASVLDFGTIPLTKLSGQDTFVVAGSAVTGVENSPPTGPPDANGTVQLNGTFTSVRFGATVLPGMFTDDIFIQIGADVVPEPSTGCLLLFAAGMATARRARRRTTQ